MMPCSLKTCAALALALVPALARAEQPHGDADLPQAFDPSAAAEQMLENSPFTRSLNLSDSLILTGIAYVEGKPVATVFNRATKESFVVSEEPNAQGWTLAGALPDPGLRHTQVRVMVGPEVVTVRYAPEQLSPENARKNPPPGPALVKPSSTTMLATTPHTSYRSSSYLGDNGRERYNSLSEKAREYFKDSMHKLIDKHPEFTPEQRAVYAEKYFARAQAEDVKQASGIAAVKAPKPEKAIKNR